MAWGLGPGDRGRSWKSLLRGLCLAEDLDCLGLPRVRAKGPSVLLQG